MALGVRVLLQPLRSSASTAEQMLFAGAELGFRLRGAPPSAVLKDETKPCKLTFVARLFDSVRAEEDAEVRSLATLAGEVTRGADGSEKVNGRLGDSGQPEGLVRLEPDTRSDETADDATAIDPEAKPNELSRRKLRFAFPSSTFSQTTATPSAPTELVLAIDTERFRYLELGVDLEVDGSPEADRSVNDLLDVLITATNPPPECTCDDCEELGPAGFEPDESDPEGLVPVPVGPGDRRKAVGLAQILLNDFIAQARLGIIDYTGAEDPADARKKLDALPTFIPVHCKFDQTTADAVVLFRTWHGDLGFNPDLDKEGWTRLIQVTEVYEPFVHREAPSFPEFPGTADLLAVDGLGESDRFLLASVGDTLPAPAVRCAKKYSRAKDFRELVQLVRDAEILLQTAGVKSPDETLGGLRGIYYGTEWSADFKKEKSAVRNTGFNVYAGTVTRPPKDPRPHLLCNLFEALQSSQDAVEGARHADWGHLIIGLEARFNGATSNIPLAGHSGLEAATWLGDLGGGAAMLAASRVKAPKTRAKTRFTGTDFGGSINLEGDVASYVVALDPSVADEPDKPVFDSSSSSPIADALDRYLKPGTNGGSEWDARAKNFLLLLGAEFTGTTFDNKSDVIDDVTDRIEAFGCYYLTNRLRQVGRITSKGLRQACRFLPGASREVATIFIDALERNIATPKAKIRALTDPAPSPPGDLTLRCRAAIQSVEAAEAAKTISDDLKRRLRFSP